MRLKRVRCSAVLYCCLFTVVTTQAEPKADVRIHMDEQQVFEEDGTYQQPSVVIRRSSHKNNLRFNADRLEGREPPTRPGINQLIRDEHEEERRRRYELESDDIVQRYVGDADEVNNTNLTVTPRSERYRAPNKAKPLTSSVPVRRYIGLTPDYSDEEPQQTEPPVVQPSRQPAQRPRQQPLQQTVKQPVHTPVPASVPVQEQTQARYRAPSRMAAPVTQSALTVQPVLPEKEAVVYPGAARTRPQRVLQPNSRGSQAAKEPAVSFPSQQPRLPKPSVREFRSPIQAPQPTISNNQPNVRSAGASYRLGQSSSGYPSIELGASEPKAVRRVVEPGPGEALIVRDVAMPEPVYQQRLIRSDDEYLKLAPPELWEEWDNAAQQSVAAETADTPAVVEYLGTNLVELPIQPDSQFQSRYVWGADTTAEESQFMFGLPWHFLSRGWQIPPMADENSKFAFLWFVVDLHQTTRDAFKWRLDALEAEVLRHNRQQKVQILDVWVDENSYQYVGLPKSERLVWDQQKQRLRNELAAFPEAPQAGLTLTEQTLLNTLENHSLEQSLEDKIMQYRQHSLEYRFYHQYFERLTRPGYGMSTRLSSSELDALGIQEGEMKAAYQSLARQLTRLETMLQRYDEYRQRVDYLRQQSDQAARSELVSATLGLLDQEEAILIQRLRAYRDVWLLGWYTNQFATWFQK